MSERFTVIPGEKVSEIEPRIKVVAFNDIQLSTQRRDLIKGLFPRTGLAVAYGPPKCGKSFWTFDVMMHVALGWEYRGRRVHQGPVVYCAFEGAHGFQARVEAFRQRHLAEDTDAIPFYLVPATLDLVGDHQELIAAIRAKLNEQAPVAVTLDTLNRSLRGSESKDEDMAAYIAAADAIREAFGCCVVVVHHCGIAADRPRGHTSLTGAIDTQLKVTRDDANSIIVEVELAKDGPQGDIITSTLEAVEVGRDEDNEAITSCVIVSAENQGPAKAHREIKGQPLLALRMLHRAMIEAGEPVPPGNPNIPAGQLTFVPLDTWRRYCYDGIADSGTSSGTQRKAFNRSVTKLQELGAIGVWGGYVWATK